MIALAQSLGFCSDRGSKAIFLIISGVADVDASLSDPPLDEAYRTVGGRGGQL